jgi:hypothetical protein
LGSLSKRCARVSASTIQFNGLQSPSFRTNPEVSENAETLAGKTPVACGASALESAVTRAGHHVANAACMAVFANLWPIQTNPDCCLKSAADIVRKGMWKRFHS